MANDKNGILHDNEALWDVALRGIGIQLPDEYILRFVCLMHYINQAGIEKVTVSDFAEIERDVRLEMERRLKSKEGSGVVEGKAGDDQNGKIDLSNEPIRKLIIEVDKLDALDKEERQRERPDLNCQKKGYAVRTANVCRYEANVKNVAELIAIGYGQFVRMRNMGEQCADIVSKALDNLYGIKSW